MAEQPTELVNLAPVQREHLAPLGRQGRRDRLRTDIRIAVHVATDPVAETQQCRQIETGRSLTECVGEHFVENRHDAIEHVGQIEADILQFVADTRFVEREFFCLPGRSQGHAHAFHIGAALNRRASAVDVGNQCTNDFALFLEQRTSGRFGRVGGEHRFDAQMAQTVAQFVLAGATFAQLSEDIAQATRLGCASGHLVFTTTTDAMHAFGHIDRLEVGRECPHQRRGMRGVDCGQFVLHRFGARIRFAPLDRGDADPFDFRQKGGAFLFGEDFTDQ